jgi:hypothetical protein
VDVGQNKDALEAKIKGQSGVLSPSSDKLADEPSEYIHIYTGFPQTLRVFFGGERAPYSCMEMFITSHLD